MSANRRGLVSDEAHYPVLSGPRVVESVGVGFQRAGVPLTRMFGREVNRSDPFIVHLGDVQHGSAVVLCEGNRVKKGVAHGDLSSTGKGCYMRGIAT